MAIAFDPDSFVIATVIGLATLGFWLWRRRSGRGLTVLVIGAALVTMCFVPPPQTLHVGYVTADLVGELQVPARAERDAALAVSGGSGRFDGGMLDVNCSSPCQFAFGWHAAHRLGGGSAFLDDPPRNVTLRGGPLTLEVVRLDCSIGPVLVEGAGERCARTFTACYREPWATNATSTTLSREAGCPDIVPFGSRAT